jgi:DNA repair ATPase RecN
MTNAIGQIVTMTNLSSQMDYMTNIISQLTGMTNIGPQVDIMTNSISQITSLTNMGNRLDSLAGMTESLTNMTVSLTNMTSSLTNMTEMLTNMVDSIQARIGAPSDEAGTNTVFGWLLSLEQYMETTAGATASSLQKIQSAKTEANKAASAARDLASELGAGRVTKIEDGVAQIQGLLESTLEQVRAIPGAMGTDSLVQKLGEAMSKLDALAKPKGVKLGDSEALVPGSANDPQALNNMINSLAETKAMMEAMRLLMDEAVNKPVVVQWMEGSK